MPEQTEQQIECKYCMFIKPASEMEKATITAGTMSKELDFCKGGACAKMYQDEVNTRFEQSKGGQ